MPQSPKRTTQPEHYAEIEAALVLFATQGESVGLRRVLARIPHPAATRAWELLAHGRPAGAEAVLEDALEAMAGPGQRRRRPRRAHSVHRTLDATERALAPEAVKA